MHDRPDSQNQISAPVDASRAVGNSASAKIISSDLNSTVFNLYEKREKIFTRKIEGFFQKVRLYTGWPLLLGYFVLPWLNIEGRQAMLFDLPHRKFHVLWTTFWPQDLIFLGWGLIIAAFALFFITTWLGRVWCGYTCPQTVWTAIFMWVEQSVEGDRNQRIKLDRSPWTLEKVFKRFIKHFIWLGFAFLTSLTFVGYFYGIRELTIDTLQLNLVPVAAFWLFFFITATYVNAGWMREQVCLHMCPYARFQSAMFDEDTLIVSYDQSRGERRGARKRGVDPHVLGMGECIDCHMCVQVCPTGIDIREGLQYECINCALCIDACDDIMQKMNYPKGLISYTTENRLAGHHQSHFRPKLIGYGGMVLAMLVLFMTVLLTRTPLELDVIRDRGRLYQETADGMVQNVYMLKILNMSKQDHLYNVRVTGMPGAVLVNDAGVLVEAGEVLNVPMGVKVDPEGISKVNYQIVFHVESVQDDRMKAESESSFIGPGPTY
jgi:cytochrome c oxidase accessory protein FixG